MNIYSLITVLGAALWIFVWFFQSPWFVKRAERLVSDKKSAIEITWEEIGGFFDAVYGHSKISIRSLRTSVLLSSTVMAIFLIVCLIFDDLPPASSVFQYLVAAVILNGLGDYVSIIQTRFLIDHHKKFQSGGGITLLFIDTVFSLLIFLIFFILAMITNIYLSGTDSSAASVALTNYSMLSDDNFGYQKAFILLSLASSTSSTIIHFVASLAVLYIRAAEAVDYEIKENLSFHMRCGAVFVLGSCSIIISVLIDFF